MQTLQRIFITFLKTGRFRFKQKIEKQSVSLNNK